VSDSSAAQLLGSGGAVGSAIRYQYREPEQTLLHRIVREHLATFLLEEQERYPSRGLPLSIRDEFERS